MLHRNLERYTAKNSCSHLKASAELLLFRDLPSERFKRPEESHHCGEIRATLPRRQIQDHLGTRKSQAQVPSQPVKRRETLCIFCFVRPWIHIVSIRWVQHSTKPSSCIHIYIYMHVKEIILLILSVRISLPQPL